MSSGDASQAKTARDRPKRRRNADTRRRIEQAAALLFTRDGYTATTMQAIAIEAGVHVQTIYLAYGTKPALLAACAVRLVAGDEDPETPPGERRWAREVASVHDPHAKLARYVQQIADVSPRMSVLMPACVPGSIPYLETEGLGRLSASECCCSPKRLRSLPGGFDGQVPENFALNAEAPAQDSGSLAFGSR